MLFVNEIAKAIAIVGYVSQVQRLQVAAMEKEIFRAFEIDLEVYPKMNHDLDQVGSGDVARELRFRPRWIISFFVVKWLIQLERRDLQMVKHRGD